MRHEKNRKTLKQKIVISIISTVLCAVLYILGDHLYLPDSGEIEIHYIDVGQGDAALILTDEEAVMVDTGTTESGEKVAAYVKAYTDTLDYMILSHPHEDHIGGASDVFDAVTVENVIMPDRTADSSSFDRLLDSIERNDSVVHSAVKGDIYRIGDLVFEILSPENGNEYDDINNISVVARLTFGDTSFLFTGDAETPVEENLLQSKADLKCDVLKVGHHGSSTSSSKDFIKAAFPDIAVISCGKDNSYGHPHREVTRLFEKLGINMYRTDNLGNIIIRSDGKTVTVK